MSVARVRIQAGTTLKGTTALGLVEAAEKLGLTAKGVKGTFEQAVSAPLPAIAHCLIDQHLLHYVVVTQIAPAHVEIMDPAEGRIVRWSIDKFKAAWTGVLILFEPGEGFRRGDHTVAPLHRFWQLMRPHRLDFALAAAAAVLSTALGLTTAVFVQQLVDYIIPGGERARLNQFAWVMLGVLGFRLGLGAMQALLSLRTAERMDVTLMLSYYRHLLLLPQTFFDTMRVGEITSRVGDAVKVRQFLNSSLMSLLLNPLIILFSLGALFFYSARLALLSLGLLPLSALVYWFVDRRTRSQERELMERGAEFGAQFTESLGAQSVIRRFRLEEHASRITEYKLRRLLKAVWRSAMLGLGSGLGMALFTQAYLVAVL